MIPSTLLEYPTELKFRLETYDPVVIKVTQRKHSAEFKINTSKQSISAREEFFLTFTLTNRSSYAVYVPADVNPYVSGSPRFAFQLEIAPLSSAMSYQTKMGHVTDIFRGAARDLEAAGAILRLNPGQSLEKRLGFIFAEMSDGMPFAQGTKLAGRYTIRARYNGLGFPAGTSTELPALDEMLYSNPLEIIVAD